MMKKRGHKFLYMEEIRMKTYQIVTSDFGWKKVNHEFILFSTKQNSYYSLNQTSEQIWTFLYNNTSSTINTIVNYMQEKYPMCPRHELQQDIEDLMGWFITYGIVKEEG